MTAEFRDDAIWVTWERQTRNRSTSAYFNVPLFEFNERSSYRVPRYLKNSLGTVALILKRKPRYFFAQNPSVVLAFLAICLKRLGGFKVIIDAHNAGVHGPDKNCNMVSKLNQFIIRKADAIIVTNSELANYVNSLGGNAIVLPDPLPQLPFDQLGITGEKQRGLKALCITSWSDDEPFLEIIEAASWFEGQIDFYFSGNYKKIEHKLPERLSRNVSLLGFVDENVFHRNLFTADFCIDMTKRPDCMVCGAYESIAAEKPIILSDTSVQRSYFSKGTIFTENSTLAIVEAIESMKNRIATMKIEAAELRSEILEREIRNRTLIQSKIYQL